MAARFALLLCLALCCAGARADGCSAVMSDVSFASVNPISTANATSSGTGTITCSWTTLSSTPPFLLLFPNVLVCVNLGIGTNSSASNPRTLGNGGNLLQYNLYRDSSYAAASIWGTPTIGATPTPFSFTLSAPLLTGGSTTQSFTAYGSIPAGAALAAVPTVANGNTVYTSSFTGAATVTYSFYNLLQPATCTSGAGGSSTFSFSVNATLTNQCTIAASPLTFAASGVLNSPLQSSSTLSVQCVNNDAYQIALNGGSTANSVTARKMIKSATGETLSYLLSQTPNGTTWGDGTGGTSVYAGTGTGAVQSVTVYGTVPSQSTPSPGQYNDTVTATIYF